MSLELFRINVAHGTIMKHFCMILSVKGIGHNTKCYELNKMQNQSSLVKCILHKILILKINNKE